MADPFNPWEFFQEAMRQGGGNSQTDWGNQDLSWIADYVNDMMQQSFPGQYYGGSFSSTRLKQEVFETHDFIIARIEVPEDIDPEHLKVYFLTNELKVEGVDSETQRIQLPRNGLYKGSKAIYKEGILEIKIPKRARERFQEIPVQISHRYG